MHFYFYFAFRVGHPHILASQSWQLFPKLKSTPFLVSSFIGSISVAAHLSQVILGALRFHTV